MASMQLSAIMNLGGNFYAQMQRNSEAIQKVKSSVSATSSQVKQMASTIANQTNNITSSWEKMGNKIHQVKKNIANSTPIQSLTKSIAVARDAAGVAGLATAGFLKGAIDAAAKGQKTTKDLEQTIKSTGGAAGLTAQQVSGIAASLSKVSTYGAGAIKTGQNMLLTFTNIGKDVFPGATQAMLDMSTKMGTDLPQTAMQLGKALNDPATGIAALHRVGVNFTEQQKEQIKTMVEAGNVAGAQKIILTELNREFGGQAAAATQTYQGRLQQLNNTIGAIKGSIGAALLPYVQKIAEAFLSFAQKIQGLSKPFIDVIAKVLAATAVFGTLIGGLGLMQKIIPLLVPQFTMLTTLFTKLTGPIGIVIGLFAAFAYAYSKNLGGFKTFMDSVFSTVNKALTTFSNSLKSGQSAGQAFYSAFKNIFGSGFANGVGTAIDSILFSVKGLIKFIQGDLKGSQNMFYYIFGSDDKKYEQSAAKIVATLTFVKTGLKAAIQGIVGLVTGDFKNFSTTLQSLGLSSGITSKVSGALQLLRTIVVNTLTTIKNSVVSVFGFLVQHSDAVITALKLIGVGFVAFKAYQGILKGIQIAMAAWAAITKAVTIAQIALNFVMNMNPFGLIILGITAFIAVIVLLWNKCTPFRNFFINLWTSIKTGALGAVNGLVTGVKNSFNSIKTGITSACSTIKTVAVAIWNGIKVAVLAVAKPLVSGVLAIFSGMKGGISTSFNGIKNIIKGGLGIIKNIVLGPILLIIDLIKGNWSKLGSDAKAILGNLGKSFKLILVGIKQIFIGHLTAIIGAFKAIWSGLGNILKRIGLKIKISVKAWWYAFKFKAINSWNNLKESVINVALDIWQGIVNAFNAVVDFFKNLPGTLYKHGVAMFTSLKDGAWSIVCGIGTWITEKFNAALDFFKNLPSKMLEFGKNFIQGFIDGVNSMIDAVINKVKDVGSSVEKKIREVLGIHSPSRVMHGLGEFTIQGLANGMNSSKHLLTNASAKIGQNIPKQFREWGKDIPASLSDGISDNARVTVDTITDMANGIRRLIHFTKPDEGPLKDSDTYGPDMVKGLSEGIQDNMPLTTNATISMVTNIRNVIVQLIKDSLVYGQQIVANLGLGVQDSTSNLVSIVKTLTDKVTTTFKEGFGIHSPSKVMYQMGNFLMQGLINGMTSKDMKGFIKNWIGSMTNAAGGAINGNLAGWITAAMALTGVSSDWFSPLATLIEHESGGNPMSINLWDSNAAAGHPSKGLMQLIDENMADHHLPGMDNIYDPISNIAAGIRLIQHDYGSIYNVPGIRALSQGRPYVGYATGTEYATSGWHWVGEHGPELMKMRGGENIIDHRNSVKMVESPSMRKEATSNRNNKFDIKVQVDIHGNVIGNEQFAECVGQQVAKKIILAIDNA